MKRLRTLALGSVIAIGGSFAAGCGDDGSGGDGDGGTGGTAGRTGGTGGGGRSGGTGGAIIPGGGQTTGGAGSPAGGSGGSTSGNGGNGGSVAGTGGAGTGGVMAGTGGGGTGGMTAGTGGGGKGGAGSGGGGTGGAGAGGKGGAGSGGGGAGGAGTGGGGAGSGGAGTGGGGAGSGGGGAGSGGGGAGSGGGGTGGAGAGGGGAGGSAGCGGGLAASDGKSAGVLDAFNFAAGQTHGWVTPGTNLATASMDDVFSLACNATPGSVQLTTAWSATDDDIFIRDVFSGQIGAQDWTARSSVHAFVKVTQPAPMLRGVRLYVQPTTQGASQLPAREDYALLIPASTFADGAWHEISLDLAALTAANAASMAIVGRVGLQIVGVAPALPTDPITQATVFVDYVWLE